MVLDFKNLFIFETAFILLIVTTERGECWIMKRNNFV